jgi:hypothetical protein
MVEGAPEAMNWMIEEGGLQLRQITNRAGGHSAYRTRTCVEGVGRGFTAAIKKIAERNGAKIRLGTKVTAMWRKDADGPVLGLETETRKGKQNIKARKADIPPKVLEEAIRKHDQYLAEGKDPEFNKPVTSKMVPLSEAPTMRWLNGLPCTTPWAV